MAQDLKCSIGMTKVTQGKKRLKPSLAYLEAKRANIRFSAYKDLNVQ